jgi:hypothetical protein
MLSLSFKLNDFYSATRVLGNYISTRPQTCLHSTPHLATPYQIYPPHLATPHTPLSYATRCGISKRGRGVTKCMPQPQCRSRVRSSARNPWGRTNSSDDEKGEKLLRKVIPMRVHHTNAIHKNPQQN